MSGGFDPYEDLVIPGEDEPPPTDPWDVDLRTLVDDGPAAWPEIRSPGTVSDEEIAARRQADEATEADLAFNRQVHEALEKLRVAEAARVAFIREKAPPAPPFDAGSLREILARPPEPPYLIDRLIPAEASTLVTAMRKTGKTTLMLNLTHSLLTGEPFLGEFDVQQIAGSVGFLNYEVSGGQLGRWAAEHGIDRDRLHLVNLRGKRNPLTHQEDRAAVAAWLRAREIESLIVDPFGRAYSGASQNDAGEVGSWLVQLDEFTRSDVGARDLFLTAHAGWNGDRTRGSSALEDWPDAIITMTRDEDADDGQRFIRAMGRDVEVEEDALRFDSLTRRLTLSGTGSRSAGRHARALSTMKTSVLLFVQENPGCSGAEIERGVGGRKEVVSEARKSLVTDGVMVEEKRPGRGGGMQYTVLTLAGAA